MKDRRYQLGIIGAGSIAGTYLENFAKHPDLLDIHAIANRTRSKCYPYAEKYGIEKVLDNEELINDPDIDIVVILTHPDSHYELGMKCLEAGKHIYVEKPLAGSIEEVDEMVALARSKGLMVCGAPDVYFGPAFRKAKQIIDDGIIGDVISANISHTSRGPQGHPNPGFYFRRGGGVLLDIGPYFFGMATFLLGPVESQKTMTAIGFPERFGVKVECPTTSSSVMRMKSGAVVTLIMSYDCAKGRGTSFEIYGTKGSMRLPPANYFGGDITLDFYDGKSETIHTDEENIRGYGVYEMALALRDKRSTIISADSKLYDDIKMLLSMEKDI